MNQAINVLLAPVVVLYCGKVSRVDMLQTGLGSMIPHQWSFTLSAYA